MDDLDDYKKSAYVSQNIERLVSALNTMTVMGLNPKEDGKIPDLGLSEEIKKQVELLGTLRPKPAGTT